MASQFKDLVIDAVDVAAAAAFWADVLGLQPEEAPNGAVLRGEQPTDTVWINAVPEPRTVKNRVHLDVHVGAIEDLLSRGATVVDDRFRWTVLTDPDGQEFCAFVREADRLPELRMYELVIDCADPVRLARWWADRLGADVETDDEDGSAWIDGGGLGWPMVFGAVPEPKMIKNRVHWDVLGDVAEYLQAGARIVSSRDDVIRWDILADPEGNEFCVFAPEG